MRYSQTGILKDTRPWGKMFVAGAAAVTLSVAIFASAFAVTQLTNYVEHPFNEAELSNWEVDRAIPSGGFQSMDGFAGRDDVLEMSVAGADRSTSSDPFYYTEGLKREAENAETVRADLYIDKAWASIDVRAGLWGVGRDDSDDITAYPIAEFTTAGGVAGDYVGWRVFNDEAGGWINLPEAEYKYGKWNTVEIKFNTSTTAFDVYVNGDMAGSSVATGSVNLGSVILNNYNYGSAGADYSVRWSKFALGNYVNINSVDDCKNGGFVALGFKNQGSCVSYVKANPNASFKREQ